MAADDVQQTKNISSALSEAQFTEALWDTVAMQGSCFLIMVC